MCRVLALALLLGACSTNPPETATTAPTQVASTSGDNEDSETGPPSTEDALADVVGVSVGGEPGSYTFAVTLESPDTGCDQYADWWEVLDQDGALLYRRILGHSHVDEQPFTRTGGPLDIAPDQVVFVRGHMNVNRYGGDVFAGSIEAGFQQTDALPGISSSVESAAPQPESCAF